MFDIEMLLLAEYLGIPVGEVSVNWQEVSGSKMNLVGASFEMLMDLLIVRGCYMLRIWKPVNIHNKEKHAKKL